MRRRYIALAALLLLVSVLLAVTFARKPTAPAEETPQAKVQVVSREGPDAPDTPRHKDVECELMTRAPGDAASILLTEYDEQTMEPIGTIPVQLVEGWLVFTPRRSEGLAKVSWPGQDPIAVGWADGACLSPVAPRPRPKGIIEGQILGELLLPGEIYVSVSDCGLLGSPVGKDGHYEIEVNVPEGDALCNLHASISFGSRMYSGPPAKISVSEGGRAQLDLELPDLPTIGWDLMPTSGVLRVMGIVPASPAERAGLQLADRILEIDGRPAESFAPEELDELELPSRIRLERDGEIEDLVIGM